MMVATYRSTCLAISKQHKLAVLLLFKRRAGLLLLIREFKFNARYARWLKFVFQLEKNTANMLFSVALRILVLSGFAISAIAVPIPAGDPPSTQTMAGHLSTLHDSESQLKTTGPEWPSLSDAYGATAAARQQKPSAQKKQNPPVQQGSAPSAMEDNKWPALSAALNSQNAALRASRRAGAMASRKASADTLLRTAPKTNFVSITQTTLNDHPLLKHVWVRAKPLAAEGPESENPGPEQQDKDPKSLLKDGLRDAIRFEVKDREVWIWYGQFFRDVNPNFPSVSWMESNVVSDKMPHFPLNGYWAEVGSLLQAPSTKHLKPQPVEGRQVIEIEKDEGNSAKVRFLQKAELERHSGTLYLYQNYRYIPTELKEMES